MKGFAMFVAFVFLLFVSAAFGYRGQRTEMAEIIVAASLALAFLNIEKFEEFRGLGFSAKLRRQLQAILDKETEPTTTKGSDAETDYALVALSNVRYTWRTIAGIAKEANKDKRDVRARLTLLRRDGLVTSMRDDKGKILWALTRTGRERASPSKGTP